MSSGADFEATLEALGQARESSESEYFTALEELRARAKRLLVAMQEAEELAAQGAGVVAEPTAAELPSGLPEPALADARAI